MQSDALAPQVAHLQELRNSALEERATASLALGRHTEVVAELEPLVAAHPLREGLRARLMLALYRSGRQADALARYAEARELLAEELGIDPGPELARLHEQILRQDPALDWHAPAAPDAQAPSASQRPHVGRELETQRLVDAWKRAQAGDGGLVLLAGEAGIGKSRLTAAIASHAAQHGGTVHWGRCFETEGAPAFWPWTQVLRSTLAALGDAALTRAVGTSASDLATLVPEIKERLPGTLPPSAADPAEARFRLVDAISRCVCAAATERPVLLALEDLHWADVPSLDVVRLLAATLQGTPLLAIATYRDTVAERGAPLSAALPTLVREPAVTHLPLHGLPPDAVATLARTVLGHDPQPALVEDLHERTEGNPFYATQLLSLVTNEGTLPAEVPASVREVVQRRAGALPPATREALEAAAVIGRDFDLPTLAATCGQARADLLDALDAAVQAGLVLTTEHPQRYRFEHLLARDALYAALPPGRRARLHAAVGEALDDDPSRVAEVAHHYELAAPLGLTERAIDTAFRAADRAESVFAFESVEQHLRQVVRLADADPQRELQAQARLVRLLVATQGYAGPGVRPAALRARELADRVGDVATITLVRWGLALDACVRRGFAESQALGEEQIAASRAAGDAVGLAVGLQQTGTALWHQGRLAEAVEHLRAAAERFRGVGVEAWRARGVTYSGMLASGHLALALSAVGPYEEARTVRDATLAMGRETGEAFELVSALNVFPMWGMFALEEETARQHREELESLLERHAFPAIRAFAAIEHGWLEARAGDPAGLERLQAAAAALVQHGVTMLQPQWQAAKGDALEALGRDREALAAYDAGLADAEASGEHLATPELLRRRGMLAGRLGEDPAPWLERALALAQEQGAGHVAARATADLDA